MASRRLEELRIAFQRYKDDVKREGKPFYPYAMFHDTVMSLVVVSVIVGLACIWHFTADGTHSGVLGKEYNARVTTYDTVREIVNPRILRLGVRFFF